MLETVQAPSSSVRFTDWTKERSLPAWGTNAGTKVLPFQGWRRFKEAFAPELVQLAVDETQDCLGRELRRIADPFGGSGTTALAAQFLGVEPSTIEVNPFLADLIEAKIARYDLDETAKLFGQVVEDARRIKSSNMPFPGAPTTFVEPGVNGRFIFSLPVANRLAAYRDAISKVSCVATQRLFKVILASVAIPVSNVVVSGKGRRYRRNIASRNVSPDAVDKLFREGMLAAMFDLRRYENRRCRSYSVLRGDARELTLDLEQTDLAVFSPPYPNSFDYTDVYNVELWALGYLDSRESNRDLRRATLRSHVQIKRDMSCSGASSKILSECVERLCLSRHELWDEHIPDMICAYFDDMRQVLAALRTRLVPGGRIYLVVGDSSYAGVSVPVGRILAEEAPHLGLQILRSEPFRSMRASPQQGGRSELAETLLVLAA